MIEWLVEYLQRYLGVLAAGVDIGHDILECTLLEAGVHLAHVELLVQRLHRRLAAIIVAAIVGQQASSLAVIGQAIECLHHQPRALAIAYVHANLADGGRIAITIEIIILHLEEETNLAKNSFQSSMLFVIVSIR